MACYAFSLDLDRCIGCAACTIACKTGNDLADHTRYIAVNKFMRGHIPNLFGSFAHQRCFHCEDAACVQVCPTGALSKWNGLTVVDAAKCSACGYCTDACPFEIPTLAAERVSKCIACFDQVNEGALPWCVQTCPSQALRFGERARIVADLQARRATIQARFPAARLYGETELGGLGLVMLLLDQPQVYGLPENPQVPLTLTVWQRAIQPASIGLSLTALAVTGASFIIARRQHLREHTRNHQTASLDQIGKDQE